MNKTWIILLGIIFIVIPAGFFYVLNFGNPIIRALADHKIPEYLHGKGYEADEIQEMNYVEPKHLINSDVFHGHYKVIFKDEPDLVYYYGIVKKDRSVKQFCEKEMPVEKSLLSSYTKHSEKSCIQSLENRGPIKNS
ncbi:DUF3139 domain-containing protein [Mesobacillus subterraneus]|uniref:DUF3139 domain-containing protein n=1 Tax=Mesobacillus subterraneus TaxID=285983 RepID=A0A427TR75_9BACI|nr:DUF3139 domain-containing protein [Mesobacillus subterraneus]RSD26889.1 DUF3139 domain-containing protein [Mesobacillus subterraneus]